MSASVPVLLLGETARNLWKALALQLSLLGLLWAAGHPVLYLA